MKKAQYPHVLHSFCNRPTRAILRGLLALGRAGGDPQKVQFWLKAGAALEVPWAAGRRGWEQDEERRARLARSGVKRAMVWCQPARSPSWQDSGMERVLGIGGYFMRAADPAALSAWYRDCLGMDADENGLWRQGAGLTVFATFESETGYFGSRAQQTMLNFRVRDLDAMLAQLRAKGADVAEETQDMEGVGRFGWVTDPEGNRVELWQPA